MNDVTTVVRLSLCTILTALQLGAVTCESLASIKLPGTSITAQVVASGEFVPPGPAPSAGDLATYKTLPAFCRVQGVIQPTTDSHIEFEV
jgi:hypothetical protein